MSESEPDEKKLLENVLGLDEYRRQGVPTDFRIPKKLRLHSTGRRCGKCGHEAEEGHEDAHGVWHYRCTYCVEHADPKGPDPCPRCQCTAHQGFSNIREGTTPPFKPQIENYRCLNCGFEWTTPEFEKYILSRVVVSVTSKSPFFQK